MARILITGAAGQIGSELVVELRRKYGNEYVVAAGSGKTPLPQEIAKSGPYTSIDVTDYDKLAMTLREHDIGTIYHMSGILSKSAEDKRRLGFNVNNMGLFNVLEASVANGVNQVIVPSSIAALGPFGASNPRENTPNDSYQRPTTMYGIAKVLGEMLSSYYSNHQDPKTRLDVRGVRFPGILAWATDPNPAGTTDYANYMIFDAVRHGHYFDCPLKEGTMLPMMYMPDAIKALIDISEADRGKLIHHGDFNVSAFNFTPAELAEVIKRVGPEFGIDNFEVRYNPDPARQLIADSWTKSMNDTAARREWGWKPNWGLEATVKDMIEKLKHRIEIEASV